MHHLHSNVYNITPFESSKGHGGCGVGDTVIASFFQTKNRPKFGDDIYVFLSLSPSLSLSLSSSLSPSPLSLSLSESFFYINVNDLFFFFPASELVYTENLKSVGAVVAEDSL